MKSIINFISVLIMMCGFSPLAFAEKVEIRSDKLSLSADWEPVTAKVNEAVLLLHGTMAHKDMEIIQTLQNSLAENDISSLAISLSLNIDQRSGMLSCDVLQTHRHANALNELSQWIQWLTEKGIDKIWLLGHSRGGNQVTSYVLVNPGKIAGMVLIAPPSVDSQSVAENYQRRYQQPLESILTLAQMQAANGSGQALEKIGFLHCTEASVSPQSFLSYYRDANLNTAELLKNIDLPTLVVSGTDDRVSPNIGAAAARLNKSNISLLEVEGADHFFRDLYADDIVDAIIELMEVSQ